MFGNVLEKSQPLLASVVSGVDPQNKSVFKVGIGLVAFREYTLSSGALLFQISGNLLEFKRSKRRANFQPRSQVPKLSYFEKNQLCALCMLNFACT